MFVILGLSLGAWTRTFTKAALPSQSRIVLAAMIAITNSYPCYTNPAKHGPALTPETWPLDFDVDGIVSQAVTAIGNSIEWHQYGISTRDTEIGAVESNRSFSEGFGTLSYGQNARRMGYSNLGDQAQSFAGLQFIPYLNTFVDREAMALDTSFRHARPIDSGETTTVFLNAWYGISNQQQWPPGSEIDPLLISMHLDPGVKPIMTNEASKAYYERHGPVGARDTDTLAKMRCHAVTAQSISAHIAPKGYHHCG